MATTKAQGLPSFYADYKLATNEYIIINEKTKLFQAPLLRSYPEQYTKATESKQIEGFETS